AFLDIDLPGSKRVIGDGPLRDELERRYPKVRFLGSKPHDALTAYYNCADGSGPPTRTATFRLVTIRAIACRVPAAGDPVEGPIDVVSDGRSGILDHNLTTACFNALNLKRSAVREHALGYSWATATQQFVSHLHPVRSRAVVGKMATVG